MIDFNEYYKLDNIVMNVANTCPLRCSYCYAHKMKGLMSNELAEKIIDECYQNHIEKGSYQTFEVSFYGGEPLLNWDCIKHTLEYSKQKKYDIKFGITTNLVILTDEMIEYFKNYNMKLLISMDGDKKLHDRNRCHSYNKVKNNLLKLLDNGLKDNISIRMTVTPECCKELWYHIYSIIELGVNDIETVLVTDIEWSKRDLYHLRKGLESVWDNVLESYYTRKPYNVKFVSDYIESDLLIGNKKQIHVCSAGDCRSCSIGVDGEIMPCHQRHLIPSNYDKVLLGNIRENSVKIREKEFNNFTRKSAFYDCEECIANVICKGGCPSENLTQNGDGNIMNKQQCMIQRILYEVALEKVTLLIYMDSLNMKLPPYLKRVVKNCKVLSLIKEGLIKNLDEIERLLKSLKAKNVFESVKETFKEQKEIALNSIDK